MNVEKIEAVFRDAHVTDVDFSLWDREVRLVVVAVEETASPQRLLPVYEVAFSGITEFDAQFSRWGRPIEGQHRQWNIYGVEITDIGPGRKLVFRGSSQDPILGIVCEDVAISPLDLDILDRLFPGWARPGAPLARPGIRELWSARSGRSGQ